MPTTEELGRKIKAKHPGAYDDLSDGELGRKVQAKYPGAYDDFTEAPAAGAGQQPTAGSGQQPAAPGAMDRFREGAWRNLDPVAGLQDIVAATSQPGTTLFNLGKAHFDLAKQAAAAAGRGEYGKALRQGVHSAIPVLGLGLESAAEKMYQGDVAGGLGETTGLMLSLGIPEAIRRAPDIPASVPVFPRVQNLNPVEAQAVQFAQQRGIPLSSGTATGNKWIGGAQKLSSYTPLGSLAASTAEARTTAGFQRVAGELAGEAYPQRMVPERAGADVRGAIETRAGDFRSQAGQEYGAFEHLAEQPSSVRTVQQGVDAQGNPVFADISIPVDVRRFKLDLQPVYDRLNRVWDPARKYSSQTLQSMRTIIEGPDFIPAREAEDALGGLKRMSREDPRGEAGGGFSRRMIPTLQNTIDNAVRRADPTVLPSLQEGRRLSRRAHEVEALLEGDRAAGLPPMPHEPVQAYGQLTWGRDTGIERLRAIERETPGELPKVGRAFLEHLFEKATEEGGFTKTRGILNRWQDLGPETKQLLFPNPMLRQNIGDFLLAAQKTAENPNPSGTAMMGTISGLGSLGLTDPYTAVAGMLGAGGIAKALYSPRTARLLIRGVRLPLRGTAGASAWLAELVREAGRGAATQSNTKQE